MPQMETEGHWCSWHPQNQDTELRSGTWVYQRQVTISKSRSRCQTPVRKLQCPPNEELKDMDVLCTFKIKIEPKFGKWIHQQPVSYKIKIKMPNPSQEPPASWKAPNQDLKDVDGLCTFKIKIESPNSDHGCVKDQ